MASFFVELWNGIFTPGPTPTILIATNVSFGALQLVLFLLLIATWSIHFVILSILSGGLWGAINWFAAEFEAAKARGEVGTQQSDDKSTASNQPSSEDNQPVESSIDKSSTSSQQGAQPVDTEGTAVRQRKAPEKVSNASTEDEWEKVSETE